MTSENTNPEGGTPPAGEYHFSGFAKTVDQVENTDDLGRPVNEPPVNRNPWKIDSESFLPFDSEHGNGLSLVAQCSNVSETTEHSISFIRGRDNDFNQVVLDGAEGDEALKARLRRALLDDMNTPNTARLIDHRFH